MTQQKSLDGLTMTFKIYKKKTWAWAAVVIAMFASPAQTFAQEPPKFSLPVDCKNSETCFVQNLVDMDTSDRRHDPFCGRATYNDHKGTDFRTRNIVEMNEGVAVFAMADGVVGGSRGNAPDRLVKTEADRKAVKNVECGNGLIMEHGRFDGKIWTTQYCHLKQGTVTAKKGDKLKRGQKIGEIGLSGMTVFPHVHVTFRKGKTVLDPFSGRAMGDVSACGQSDQNALFTADALKLIREKDSPLLNAGFAGGPVSKDATREGKIPETGAKKPLVFFGYFKNLLLGDRIRITITEDGKPFYKSTGEALPVDKASYTAFGGKRSGMKKGATYSGIVEIIRENKSALKSEPVSLKF